jgi:preprotein translocase subunit SecA
MNDQRKVIFAQRREIMDAPISPRSRATCATR